MKDAQWNRILAGLEAAGWAWRDDNLYGPHDTMWLGRESWSDTLVEFLERMEGRRDRIRRNHDAWDGDDRVSAGKALSDVVLLVEVLQRLRAD